MEQIMITEKERNYLRTLAEKQREMAQLPVMGERKKLWYLHNELKGPRPMIVMEEETFLNEILPPLQCQDPDARRMEKQILQTILPQQIFQDDKVVTEEFKVDVQIENKLFDVEMKKQFASDGIGYHIEPVMECLEEDMDILKDSVFSYNKKETTRRLELAQEVLGDILQVRPENRINQWEFSLTEKAVWLMGSGSYCFSKELPGADYQGKVLSRHLWGHMNSQESVYFAMV